MSFRVIVVPRCPIRPRLAVAAFVELADQRMLDESLAGLQRGTRLAKKVMLSRTLLCFRNGTARVQTVDLSRAESKLQQYLLVVFANLRGALC